MIALALLILGASNVQDGGDSVRLDALRRLVQRARQIEAVCQPRLLTDPPTPVRIVPELDLDPGLATGGPGGFYVSYGRLHGVVRSSKLTLTFQTAPQPGDAFHTVPENTRLWTREECLGNARAVAELLRPDGYALGSSYPVHPEDPDDFYILTDLVLREDPRLVVGRIDLPMDATIGFPTDVWDHRPVLPKVDPDRVRGVLGEEILEAEALRVHRGLPSIGAARRERSPYEYRSPDVLRRYANELTPTHLGHAERGEAIPIYRWGIAADLPNGRRWRSVWVDARTGRAMAYADHERRFRRLGTSPTPKVATSLVEGSWRVGRTTGRFEPAASMGIEGVATVVTNVAGEVRTLRFDAKLGLVVDETGTYRPDAALLRAMRAQKAVRPFGRR